jgi:hypothetical protein
MNTVGWTSSAYFDGNTLWADGEVTHPEVIPKLLRETSDGRRELNYVSMGAEIVPICSICNNDIRECGHERGKDYEGSMCKVYATDTKFNHLAITNQPADKKARIGTVQVAASSLNKLAGLKKKKTETSQDSGVPAPATTPRGYNLTVGPGITVEQYALAHQREHEGLDAKLASIGAKLDALVEGLQDEAEQESEEDVDEVVDMAKKRVKAQLDEEKDEEKSFVGDVGGDTTAPNLNSEQLKLPAEQKERFPVATKASEDVEISPEEIQNELNDLDEEEEAIKRRYVAVARKKKYLLNAAKNLVTAQSEVEEVAPAVNVPSPADAGPGIERPTEVKYPGGVAAESEAQKYRAIADKYMAKAEDIENKLKEGKEEDEEAHVEPFGVSTPGQDGYQRQLREGNEYPGSQIGATRKIALENATLKSRLDRLEKQRKFELATRISSITGKSSSELASKSLGELEAIHEVVKDLKSSSEVASKVPEFASYDENFGSAKETAEERIKKYGVGGALKYACEEDIRKGRMKI